VDDATITPEEAAQVEMGEVNAWIDMYSVLPDDFARQFEVEMHHLGDVVLTRSPRIPFVHFNCVKNLGVAQPATEAALDAALARYREAGVARCTIYHTPINQPAQLPEWLLARGLRQQGGWDRIYRDAGPLAPLDDVALPGHHVEKVSADTAAEWAGFIDRCYGLPTSPWLLAFANRAGWHHYLLRQGVQIVAVRSMFIDADGRAWFGVEAPVPGMMAPSFAEDLQLCTAMVRDGLALGARSFAADIEAPDAAMRSPAYANFARLGFSKLYFRSHYCS
jgi:hypothetical protein